MLGNCILLIRAENQLQDANVLFLMSKSLCMSSEHLNKEKKNNKYWSVHKECAIRQLKRHKIQQSTVNIQLGYLNASLKPVNKNQPM